MCYNAILCTMGYNLADPRSIERQRKSFDATAVGRLGRRSSVGRIKETRTFLSGDMAMGGDLHAECAHSRYLILGVRWEWKSGPSFLVHSLMVQSLGYSTWSISTSRPFPWAYQVRSLLFPLPRRERVPSNPRPPTHIPFYSIDDTKRLRARPGAFITASGADSLCALPLAAGGLLRSARGIVSAS